MTPLFSIDNKYHRGYISEQKFGVGRMVKDNKHLLLKASDLQYKIEIGNNYIAKARAEGKDVSHWERKIRALENELDSIYTKLFTSLDYPDESWPRYW